MHRSLVVDGLFTPHRGTPCHFCFFQRWEKLEKAKKDIQETRWINYFDYVTKRTKLSLSLPITRSEIGVVTDVLKKKLSWLAAGESLTTPFKPLTFTRLNLDTGQIDADLVPHSPYCGCFAGECL